jgi:hypothetical protein
MKDWQERRGKESYTDRAACIPSFHKVQHPIGYTSIKFNIEVTSTFIVLKFNILS